jgi:sugar (pentulose or hexulose) kinase
MTGLADIQQLTFANDLLERAEISASGCRTLCGPVPMPVYYARRWPSATGTTRRCRLITGCLDQFAGAIGVGNTEPDCVSETTGTVLATVRCADSLSDTYQSEVFQGPAFRPNLFYQMVFSSISATLLELYRNHLPDCAGFEISTPWRSRFPMGAEGLRINRKPLRAATWTTSLRAMRPSHRGHEVRAILEGVADELHRQVKLLCSDSFPKRDPSCGWRSAKSPVA